MQAVEKHDPYSSHPSQTCVTGHINHRFAMAGSADDSLLLAFVIRDGFSVYGGISSGSAIRCCRDRGWAWVGAWSHKDDNLCSLPCSRRETGFPFYEGLLDCRIWEKEEWLEMCACYILWLVWLLENMFDLV